MTHDEIILQLRQQSAERLEQLWRQADQCRRQSVGDAVHLRGLVELSNHCSRRCSYCGISTHNADLTRYRMNADEVLQCARDAVRLGYGTVVLQAGEDPSLTTPWVSALIRRIKDETPLAVTLSLGERSDDELASVREAGADRYLLRFETSNRALFDRIHPPKAGQSSSDRVAILKRMRELGYEVGSGVMIGLPGQTWDDLARDLELFGELDLDMIGVGPWLPHPQTPLARQAAELMAPTEQQVPNTELMTYKVVALARLLCPRANIPSTTALATLNQQGGRELGLQRGANIVMPNLTPLKYRQLYEIYPAKSCLAEEPDVFDAALKARIQLIGRTVGAGRGDSPNISGRRSSGGHADSRKDEEMYRADTLLDAVQDQKERG